MNLRERFHKMHSVNLKGCWIWQGALTAKGYGVISVEGKSERAHRISYRIFGRPIPKGLHVLHKCDVPSCVNPDHLFVGTDADNMEDRKSKGRLGFKLSEDNISEIRYLYAEGGVTQEYIAGIYGVGRNHISRIVNKKRWAN